MPEKGADPSSALALPTFKNQPMPRPNLDAVPPFYHRYISLVQQDDVNRALSDNTSKTVALLEEIPEEKWSHRYETGKWSIREMVQHLIDAERIFSYRALCIARGEKQSLPGFEENDYAAASGADRRNKEDLLEEFRLVRKSTEALFRSFTEDQLHKIGVANNKTIPVNAIGFITAGHAMHHLNILRERYL